MKPEIEAAKKTYIEEFVKRAQNKNAWVKREDSEYIAYTLKKPYAVLTVDASKGLLEPELPAPEGMEFLDDLTSDANKERRNTPWRWQVKWNYEPNDDEENPTLPSLPIKMPDTKEELTWLRDKGIYDTIWGNQAVGSCSSKEEAMSQAEDFYNTTVEEANQQGRLKTSYNQGDSPETYTLLEELDAEYRKRGRYTSKEAAVAVLLSVAEVLYDNKVILRDANGLLVGPLEFNDAVYQSIKTENED